MKSKLILTYVNFSEGEERLSERDDKAVNCFSYLYAVFIRSSMPDQPIKIRGFAESGPVERQGGGRQDRAPRGGL